MLVPLQGLKSAVGLVLCIHAGVSELLVVHDQRMGWNDRSRDNLGTALRNTDDCRLRSKGGSRLGAYTSQSRPDTEELYMSPDWHRCGR